VRQTPRSKTRSPQRPATKQTRPPGPNIRGTSCLAARISSARPHPAPSGPAARRQPIGCASTLPRRYPGASGQPRAAGDRRPPPACSQSRGGDGLQPQRPGALPGGSGGGRRSRAPTAAAMASGYRNFYSNVCRLFGALNLAVKHQTPQARRGDARRAGARSRSPLAAPAPAALRRPLPRRFLRSASWPLARASVHSIGVMAQRQRRRRPSAVRPLANATAHPHTRVRTPPLAGARARVQGGPGPGARAAQPRTHRGLCDGAAPLQGARACGAPACRCRGCCDRGAFARRDVCGGRWAL